jgi:hypothetical protein
LDKNTVINFLRKDGKRLKADLVAVLATGVMLMLLGNAFFGQNKKSNAASTPLLQNATADKSEAVKYQDLEERMTEAFSAISGVGNVRVIITFKTGSEIVVAQDEKVEENKSEESGGKTTQELNSEKKVVLLNGTGSSNSPLVLKEKAPEIEGVVIVAQGGDDIFVKEALTRGAQALLDVPAHKVEVFKMN